MMAHQNLKENWRFFFYLLDFNQIYLLETDRWNKNVQAKDRSD